MRLLFEGQLAPITSTIGFLEAPLSAAVEGFTTWMQTVHGPRGRQLVEHPVQGPLIEVLLKLLPLTTFRTRHLFVPTRSPWCAFFDNGHQGADPVSTMSFLAKQLGCRGMRVTAIANTIEGEFKGARGRYGGLALEVYGPEPTHFLNYVRTISLINDGGRWDFSANGTPFAFEDLNQYGARRQRDRFTFDMLARYLSELDLFPFDERFYLPSPDEPAVLIQMHGSLPETMKEFTLDDLRARA